MASQPSSVSATPLSFIICKTVESALLSTTQVTVFAVVEIPGVRNWYLASNWIFCCLQEAVELDKYQQVLKIPIKKELDKFMENST